MKIGKLPLKVFSLVLANDLLDTTAQLFMKKGLGHADIEHFSTFVTLLFGFQDPQSWFLWAGVFIYFFNFFLWMKILSLVELSIALPLGSFSYILVPVAAVLLLHEHVGWMRWVGLGFIMLGVYCIAQSRSEVSEVGRHG